MNVHCCFCCLLSYSLRPTGDGSECPTETNCNGFLASGAPSVPEQKEPSVMDEVAPLRPEWEHQPDQHNADTNTSSNPDSPQTQTQSQTSPPDQHLDQDQPSAPQDYQFCNGMESPEPQANGAISQADSTPSSPLEDGELMSPHAAEKRQGAGDAHDSLRNSKSPSAFLLYYRSVCKKWLYGICTCLHCDEEKTVNRSMFMTQLKMKLKADEDKGKG